MEQIEIKSFPVVGIAVRTTNANQQAASDIPQLWERFWQENILSSIPERVSDETYCIYTEFEGDYTQPYTTLIGCRVKTTENIPEGMRVIFIEDGEYMKYTAIGKLSAGVVINTWGEIWNSDLNRTYKTDYEYYGPGAANPDDATIDIFVGVY